MVQKVETMGLYEYGRIDLDPDGCDSLFIFERGRDYRRKLLEISESIIC